MADAFTTAENHPMSGIPERHRGKYLLPDLLNDQIALLIVGDRPGEKSVKAGHYFSNPRNRMWHTLHLAGLTPELLCSERDHELLHHGIGVTDLCKHAQHGEKVSISDDNRKAVRDKIARHKPKVVAFLGCKPAEDFQLSIRQDNATLWGLLNHDINGASAFLEPV